MRGKRKILILAPRQAVNTACAGAKGAALSHACARDVRMACGIIQLQK
jgi:hypothetical protein